MYCSNCGAQITGHGKFCANCGAVVAVTTAAATNPNPAQQTQQVPVQQLQPVVVQQPQPVFQTNAAPQMELEPNPMQRFRINFRGAWKSGAFLLFAICFSLCQIMNYASIEDFLSPIYQVLDYASMVSSEAEDLTSRVEMMELLIIFPGVLVAIGSWLIYTEATKKKEEPVRTVGFSIIHGVVIGLLCVLVVFVIYILGKIASLREYYGILMPRAVEALLNQVTAVILIVSSIIAIFLAILITTVAKIKHTGQGFGAEGLGWAGTTGAFSLVGGLITLIVLLASEFTLAGLLNCITMILLASSLFVYIGAMNKDRDMQYSMGMNSSLTAPAAPKMEYASNPAAGMPQNGQIPAWKRVQMEQATPEVSEEPQPEEESIVSN